MRKLDVLHDGEFVVPLRHTRVSGRQDRSSGVESGDDSCFGDGESLLLLRNKMVRGQGSNWSAGGLRNNKQEEGKDG